MRLIDADALKLKVYHEWIRDSKEIDRVVDSVPTIDAVEVVWCKECKHSRIEGETTMFMWCGYWNKPTEGIRYCSDGERKCGDDE